MWHPLLIALSAAAMLAAAQAPTARFPKPDPEKAYGELKIYDSAGSPLREPVEDWDGARQRVRDDPIWQRWLAEQREAVDDWMASRRDRVEWIAGWWHDFVSPKDGSFLTFTPDPPGQFTLSSPSDPRVELTPKIMGGWVFVFRSRHAARIADAARLFRLTGEQKYAGWAASQLDFYSGHFASWPVQAERAGSKSRLMHQSLDEANVLIQHLQAARLLENHTAPERKREWIEKLFRPQALLLGETFQRIHNIACWQRSAMAQTALFAGDEDLWRTAVAGAFGIRRQLEEGVTGDYLWFEQSLGYNAYVVRALQSFFVNSALAGRMDSLRREMAFVENMMLAPIYLRFPTGQLPNPADSTGGLGRAPNRALLAEMYRIFPTAIGLEGARRARNWDTLLDPPPAAPAAGMLPLPASRNLESSRMAILRGGDWQVYFHYGQLDRSHAQAEALNWEAFWRDIDITHDPGTVGYGSPLHAGYYTRGASHNVPLVDGEGQQGWHPGELLLFDAAAGRVRARQADYRKGVTAERELRIEDGRLIDEVTLAGEALAARPSRLALVLHLQGKVAVPPGAVPAAFSHWSGVKAFEAADRIELEVQFGQKQFRLTIQVHGPFRVLHGQAPDVPPSRRDALMVETEGSAARFQTILEPRP